VLACRRIEAPSHPPPGLPVIGQVRIAKAVELAREQLGVDHVQHGDPGLGVLGQHEIAEDAEGARLGVGEEANVGHVLDAVEHELTGHLVPVGRLPDHVVLGIAAVHLWRHPRSLAREPFRWRGLPVRSQIRQVRGFPEVRRHRVPSLPR
jgi:hypothetical protein